MWLYRKIGGVVKLVPSKNFNLIRPHGLLRREKIVWKLIDKILPTKLLLEWLWLHKPCLCPSHRLCLFINIHGLFYRRGKLVGKSNYFWKRSIKTLYIGRR